MRLHCLNTTLQMIWRLGVGVSCRAWYAWLFSFHLSSSRLPQFLESNVLSVVSIEAVHCCLQIPQFKTSRDLACHLDSHISTSKHNPTNSPCNHCQAASASTCRRGCTAEIRFKDENFIRITGIFSSESTWCFLVEGATPTPFHVGHPQIEVMWSHYPYHVLHWLLGQGTKQCWPAKTSKQHASNYYYPIVWAMGILFTDLYPVRSLSHVLNHSRRNQQDSRKYILCTNKTC